MVYNKIVKRTQSTTVAEKDHILIDNGQAKCCI